jgi:hypothetical protein
MTSIVPDPNKATLYRSTTHHRTLSFQEGSTLAVVGVDVTEWGVFKGLSREQIDRLMDEANASNLDVQFKVEDLEKYGAQQTGETKQVKSKRNGSPDVEKAQQWLTDQGYELPKFGKDGLWGAETEGAYQKAVADGKKYDGELPSARKAYLDRIGATEAKPEVKPAVTEEVKTEPPSKTTQAATDLIESLEKKDGQGWLKPDIKKATAVLHGLNNEEIAEVKKKIEGRTGKTLDDYIDITKNSGQSGAIEGNNRDARIYLHQLAKGTRQEKIEEKDFAGVVDSYHQQLQVAAIGPGTRDKDFLRIMATIHGNKPLMRALDDRFRSEYSDGLKGLIKDEYGPGAVRDGMYASVDAARK